MQENANGNERQDKINKPYKKSIYQKKTPCCKHMQQRVSTFTVNNIKLPVFYRIILHLSLLQPTNHLSVRGQMKRKNRLLYNR